MDYPKSVPGVGLVDGKFVDEDAVSGQVGSLIPSVWGNSVTDELLNVLGAAGVAPDEADHGQVLKGLRIIFAALDSPALKGTPTAPTPAQFDNSQRLATTAAVQRAIGSFNLGSNTGDGINAAATPLTNAHVGAYLYFNGGLNQTATLPSEIGLLPGSAVTLTRSVSSFSLTIKSNTGNAIIDSAYGVFASIVLNGGESVTLVWSGVAWQAFGSYVSRVALTNASSLGASGYQKYPSGLILQWGIVQSGGGGTANLTFPIAFPNQLFNITVAEINSGAGYATAGTFGIAGGPINVWAPAGTSGGAGISVSWNAIGK
ncbi:hypothetical protein V8G57_15715 [Collimonas sp. H4R21]|uniref:Putative tail fiber protein gp53-like C-terminal domain-containing protein n=1 Tax=Collimonas rhizosphaerae TaxID=3126357 RepID=A0ABU9PXW9_9BURK